MWYDDHQWNSPIFNYYLAHICMSTFKKLFCLSACQSVTPSICQSALIPELSTQVYQLELRTHRTICANFCGLVACQYIVHYSLPTYLSRFLPVLFKCTNQWWDLYMWQETYMCRYAFCICNCGYLQIYWVIYKCTRAFINTLLSI